MQGGEHTPIEQRPEATFLPTLIDHFLALLPEVVVPPVATVSVKEEAANDAQPMSADGHANGAAANSSSDESSGDDASEADEGMVGDVATGGQGSTGAADVATGGLEGGAGAMRVEELPAVPEEEGGDVLEPDAPGACRLLRHFSCQANVRLSHLRLLGCCGNTPTAHTGAVRRSEKYCHPKKMRRLHISI